MKYKEEKLFEAVENNNLNSVKQYLKYKDLNVNARDNSGNTPIFYARNPEMLSLLLAHGADVNQIDRYGNTPIFYTINPEMLSLLLAHGADVNQVDNNNQNAIFTAKNVEALLLLLKYGGNVNQIDNNGRNALFYARNPEVVSLLLAHGANVNQIDRYGNTPIFYANSPEKLSLLLEYGANVNHLDNTGRNALFSNHSTEALKKLLENNANPNKMDIYEKVPMTVQDNMENAITLLNYGAKMKINNKPIKLIYLNSLKNKKVLEDYAHSLEKRNFKNELKGIKEIAISKEKMGLWDALSKNLYENTSEYIKEWIKDNPEFLAINQTDIVYNKIIRKQEQEIDTTHKEKYANMSAEKIDNNKTNELEQTEFKRN